MARRKVKSTGKATADVISPGAFDDRKYKIRDAYSTLQRADEHRADKSLMRDVRRYAADEMKRAGRIAKMEKSDRRV